jgi:hypothetical protein
VENDIPVENETVLPGPPPRRCVCAIVGGLLRLAAAVAAVLIVVAAVAELGLRAAGVEPRRPAAAAHIVPDAWTGFRLRPGVTGEDPEVTNDFGMHAPRNYTLLPSPGSTRVAVLGSSVVYGQNVAFADTIPQALERELQVAGHHAEVLNFGTWGFNVVHVSALLQAYVHQFRPAIVVMVMDLQVGQPRWPDVRPAREGEDAIRKLDRGQALLKRGAAWSALLAVFDDPRPARRWVRRASGLPLRPRPETAPGDGAGSPLTDAEAGVRSGPAAPAPGQVRAYEDERERGLAAPLAAVAAFCAERSIALYWVTPYGPYFDFTDDELARMDVHHFLEEAARVHGGERAALRAEVELITRVVRRVAGRDPDRVIDMLEASRRATLRTSPDFTPDGVHLTAAGNRTVARLVAGRIARHADRRTADLD